MKSILLSLLCLILIAGMFMGSSITFAQDTYPPERNTLPQDKSVRSLPNRALRRGRLPLFSTSSTNTVAKQGKQSTIDLGDPGLSFRYVDTIGVTEQAYPADVQHLNGPDGLFVDTSDNLYIAETRGYRVLEFNSSGNNVLSLGIGGYCATDDYTFCPPRDVALDGSGNIWVADSNRVVQYDSSGTFLQQMPETNPWVAGDDNTHFDLARSLAFDSTGRLFVSDRSNHRVQVYSFPGSTPVYSTTIGVTGESGSDNNHFNYPVHINLDNSDQLYVVDPGNGRVQRCVYSGMNWSCSTFTSGLNTPRGVAIDSSNHVYINNSGNGQVLKCDSGGSCTTFASGFQWPADVAVDSADNVYVSDNDNNIIHKYSSSGSYLGIHLGVNNVPYLTDNQHFNSPYGIAIDQSGNIIVSTSWGFRVLKLDANGSTQWAIGTPGVWGDDNLHFGDYWSGPNNVAVDSSGFIYVADTGNHRVQIFDSLGNYWTTLGAYGSGNIEFDAPDGVAVDSSGNIYVADSGNHRVQIFNNNRVYQATLGVTGVSGSDNSHFEYPNGVEVDDIGNIYVADGENNRVQIFDSNLNYVKTLGTTGEWGDDFDHFSVPRDVAVDPKGRVYVADSYNNRVQIFDTNGAYLTTIGGAWGSNTGTLRGAMAVDVDTHGNVYVADSNNHRIQIYSPQVPSWKQVNINGYGNPENGLAGALTSFGVHLYAGVYNPETGAQLWRMSSGGDWQNVTDNGFGDSSNVNIDVLIEFNGHLYAGTWNETGGGGSNGGQIWRSATGNPGTWNMVASEGFGDADNTDMFRLDVFGGQLYATTWNPTSGGELWRSSSGNSGSWSSVILGGGGDLNNQAYVSTTEFNGYMYIGSDNSDTGAEVWRSSTGNSGSWTQVNTDGFGDQYNWSVTLEPFDDYLYAATYNYAESDNPGVEIWRCMVCNGSDWGQVTVAKGLGDTENRAFRSLIVHNNMLFGFTYNRSTGMEVWRSSNGMDWTQVGPNGLGDSNNARPYWDNSTTVYDNNLYVGTINFANGGEVWRLQNLIFLPITTR